jgi:hypothetical protein
VIEALLDACRLSCFTRPPPHLCCVNRNTSRYGYTFDVLIPEPNKRLGVCATAKCADRTSKNCGSGDGFGGSVINRVWAVYKLSRQGEWRLSSGC